MTSEAEYKQSIQIIAEVFQLSESVRLDMEKMLISYGADGKFNHYLAYYQNEPAAAMTTFVDGEVIGLYNGATIAKFQKRGLCTALLQYIAQHEAANANCQYMVSQLLSSAMAKGLTDKMGFKTYCRLQPFLKEINNVNS